MVLCMCIGVVSLYAMNPPALMLNIIQWGGIMTITCGIYLLSSQFLGKVWMKEMVVAVGYAMGIFLVPLILMSFSLLWISLLQIFLLAFLNLITFSIYEESDDRKEGFYSIVTQIGLKRTKLLAYTIFISLLITIIFIGVPGLFSAFILIGTLIFGTIHVFPSFFAVGERFRIIGDAVFLLAGICLLF